MTAEFVKIGGIRMDEPKKYDVIIDRISQDIPFYRAYLKNAIAARDDCDQQSVLVDGGRQVLQLRAGAQDGRGDSADGDFAASSRIRRTRPTSRCEI